MLAFVVTKAEKYTSFRVWNHSNCLPVTIATVQFKRLMAATDKT